MSSVCDIRHMTVQKRKDPECEQSTKRLEGKMSTEVYE